MNTTFYMSVHKQIHLPIHDCLLFQGRESNGGGCMSSLLNIETMSRVSVNSPFTATKCMQFEVMSELSCTARQQGTWYFLGLSTANN